MRAADDGSLPSARAADAGLLVRQQLRWNKPKPCARQIPGAGLDAAVGRLLVESVSPLALEVALNVQEEIQSRLDEAERLRQQQVQRAQYEADQARVHYMRVDPNNRLVADTLETQWNEKLRRLAQAKEECEKRRKLDAVQLTDEQKAQVLALASDFPKLWHDPKTPDRDRKQMARLLLEDVTLRREREVFVQVRFKGGATRNCVFRCPSTRGICAGPVRRSSGRSISCWSSIPKAKWPKRSINASGSPVAVVRSTRGESAD